MVQQFGDSYLAPFSVDSVARRGINSTAHRSSPLKWTKTKIFSVFSPLQSVSRTRSPLINEESEVVMLDFKLVRIEATNHGLMPFKPFYADTELLTAWSGGRWVFYADRDFPAAKVSEWMSWWEEGARLYEFITSQPQYLEFDSNFGERKVVSISPHEFWAIGNGQRVEISRAAFDSSLMDSCLDTKDKHGIVFYEFGRQAGYLYDFYEYAEYTDESWRRGFPIYMESLCRAVVARIDLSHTRWTNGVVERWEKSDLDYMDIFGSKEFEWDRHGFDLGILMGAFLVDLHEKLGIQFMAKFIQELRQRPGAPTSAIEAAYKVQDAAAAAAGRDLSEFFVTRWRWPAYRA